MTVIKKTHFVQNKVKLWSYPRKSWKLHVIFVTMTLFLDLVLITIFQNPNHNYTYKFQAEGFPNIYDDVSNWTQPMTGILKSFRLHRMYVNRNKNALPTRQNFANVAKNFFVLTT